MVAGNFSELLNMFEAFHSGSVIHIVAIYSTRRGVNKIPVAIISSSSHIC